MSGGPDFQLYMAGYVELFNDIETGCDNVSRAFWSDKTSSSDETGALAVPKPRFFPYQRLEIFFWCRLAKSMAIKLLIKSIDIKNSKILSMVASFRTVFDCLTRLFIRPRI
jgi:hypothetical protein